jgi:hypothetical protein
LVLTIVVSILRLYDRGWQVQRWPTPIVLGATYGWVGGVMIGTIGAQWHPDGEVSSKE